MVLVVLGIDALDPDLVDPDVHPNLALTSYGPIDTIASAQGEPSTHELWPTIITGLEPAQHGLVLEDGVAWESRLLRYGSRLADYAVPARVQTRLGAWLLNNTAQDAFRVPATYYSEEGIETVFDHCRSKPIGIPNYVTESDSEDREHQLRRRLGELFERDPDAVGGHDSADPALFYERCMEMSMIRFARARRALRSRRYELVFAYTSGLDLIGHVSYDDPELQQRAYAELDEFVGEVRADLETDDELMLVSDHGLQDGVHTRQAMVAATKHSLTRGVDSVTDVRGALEAELSQQEHAEPTESWSDPSLSDNQEVREQLEDLGYM